MEFISKIYGLLASYIKEIYTTLKKGFEWILSAIDVQAWLNSLWSFIQDCFYWVANTILLELSHLLEWVAGLMPTFQIPSLVGNIPLHVLQAINWVLPVGTLITCATVLVSSTVAYFTIGILARWLKVSA